MSDKMMLLPSQSRAARALLNWSRGELAERCGVSLAALADFEAGKRQPYDRTLADIRRSLEAAGVEFTNGDAPGVKLHKPGARVASIPLEDLNAENDE
jgi:transcriptional regulator with XRE-family HTH domain